MKILIAILVIVAFVAIYYILEAYHFLFDEIYNKKKVIHISLPHECNQDELRQIKYSMANLPVAKDYHIVCSIGCKNDVRITLLDSKRFVQHSDIKAIERFLANRYK